MPDTVAVIGLGRVGLPFALFLADRGHTVYGIESNPAALAEVFKQNQSGILGMLVAILGILLYLWFRFEWQFAVGATVATLHDVVLTIGFFSLTQLDFDLSSVAAVLTIMGYSVNDTVVIYDRIREMLRRHKRMPISDLLDLSMNSTLSRTVITSTTVILSLLGMFFFGPEAIQSFVQAMLFGAVVGVYSSAFIAAPLLIYLGVRTQGGKDEAGKSGAATPSPAGARP